MTAVKSQESVEGLPNVSVIWKPTTIPKMRKRGLYQKALDLVLTYAKTDETSGLVPHMHWNAKDSKQANALASALYGVKRRYKEKYGAVAIRKISNSEAKEHYVILWHQE